MGWLFALPGDVPWPLSLTLAVPGIAQSTRNPFNRPAPEAAAAPVAAAPVHLHWVLQGVSSGATPALGSAIIMTGQAPARLFQTDETLPGGATLLEVYPDRVLLELGDTVQTLRFPAISDSAAQGLRSMATARATGGSPGDAAGQTSEQRRELVRKRLEMLRQRALGSS